MLKISIASVFLNGRVLFQINSVLTHAEVLPRNARSAHVVWPPLPSAICPSRICHPRPPTLSSSELGPGSITTPTVGLRVLRAGRQVEIHTRWQKCPRCRLHESFVKSHQLHIPVAVTYHERCGALMTLRDTSLALLGGWGHQEM